MRRRASRSCARWAGVVVSMSLRSKSSEAAETGLVASSRMFVVVAAACQRADTHNPPFFASSERRSFASDVHDYIASYIPGHHYPPARSHGPLAAQTRDTCILQPDMERHRRRAPRPQLPARREDTPRMGAQAGNEEEWRGQRKEDMAKGRLEVACLRRRRGGERGGARCAVASSQEAAAYEPEGHGEDDPEAQWQKARVQGDALGPEKECSAK
jgi:hypothetical protein